MSVITCRSHLSWNSSHRAIGKSSDSQLSYVGGSTGSWRVTMMETHRGTQLKKAACVEIKNEIIDRPPFGSAWVLSGVVSNSRYIAREERHPFDSTQTSFCFAEATCAALIPIRKSPEWWDLKRYDRNQIADARSQRLSRAMRFLPAIARRFQQPQGKNEQFDFVTWFEYSPHDTPIFDDMLDALRSSEEWQYVDREVEIRLEYS